VNDTNRQDRVLDFAPDYIVGFVWLLALLSLLAVSLTPRHARTMFASLLAVFQPLRVPDAALGFLIAAFGILLPYALAVIASPLSSGLAGVFLRRWYKPRLDRLKVEHYDASLRSIVDLCGVPPPAFGGTWVLYYLLTSKRSPVIKLLNAIWDRVYIQSRVVIPVSALVGTAVFAVLGQSGMAPVIAFITALMSLAAVSHSAATGLRHWEETVLLAFFVEFPRKFDNGRDSKL
jgi:hypothetical protein